MTKPPEDPLWPDWLAAIYGPAPAGPRKRAEALRIDAEHKRKVNARLDELHAPPAPSPPVAAAEREYTPEELRRARVALGIEDEIPREAAE